MGGEGLGFVFTDCLAVSGLGSVWSFARGSRRSFGMSAVVGGCVSRDICLDVLLFILFLILKNNSQNCGTPLAGGC